MKHLKIGFYLLFLLPLLASSCDKNEGPRITTYEGRVLEYGTNTPIENAQVVFYDWTSTGMFQATYTPVDTVVTNASGEYFFEFISSQKLSLGLNAYAQNYYELPQHDFDFIANKHNQRDIILDPHAWLKLHIKNVNPFDEEDNILYTGNGNGSNPQDNIGTSIDLYDTQSIHGNDYVNLTWLVIRNNETIQYWDTIYCAGHDTTFYEILY